MECVENEMKSEGSSEAKKMKLVAEEDKSMLQRTCTNTSEIILDKDHNKDSSSSHSTVASKSILNVSTLMDSQNYVETFHLPYSGSVAETIQTIAETCIELSKVISRPTNVQFGITFPSSANISNTQISKFAGQAKHGREQNSQIMQQFEPSVGVSHSARIKLLKPYLRNDDPSKVGSEPVSKKLSKVGSKLIPKNTSKSNLNVRKTKPIPNKRCTKVEVLTKGSSVGENPLKVDLQSLSAQELYMQNSEQADSKETDCIEEKQDVVSRVTEGTFRYLKEKFKFYHKKRINAEVELLLEMKVCKYIRELQNLNVKEDKSSKNPEMIPKFIARFNKLRQRETSQEIWLLQINQEIKNSLKELVTEILNHPVIIKVKGVDILECVPYSRPSSVSEDLSLASSSKSVILEGGHDYVGLGAGSESVSLKAVLNTGECAEGLKDKPRLLKFVKNIKFSNFGKKLKKSILSTFDKPAMLKRQHNNCFQQQLVLYDVYSNFAELKNFVQMMDTDLFGSAAFSAERDADLRRQIFKSLSLFNELLQEETTEMSLFFHINKEMELAVKKISCSC